MSYQNLYSLRVNRKIIGSEIDGDIFDATSYTYSIVLDEFGNATDYIRAYANFQYFDGQGVCVLQGKKAVFLLNTDADNIKDIPIGSKGSVALNQYWTYKDTCTIDSSGQAYIIVNRNQIGTYAIASYCCLTDKGADKELILGS